MSDTPPDTLKERNTGRRPWLILGGIALMLLGVIVWLVFFLDAAPPDDSDMMPTWSERGGNANPLAVFLDTVQRTSIAHTRIPRLEEGGDREKFAGEMEAYLESQRDAFTALDELLETPSTRWQWPEGAGVLHAKGPPTYFGALQETGNALREKAKLASYRGDVVSAVDLCLKNACLGHGLQQAEGGSTDLLIAMYQQRAAETVLKQILAEHDAPPDLLRRCLREMTPLHGPTPETTKHALKVGYQWVKRCTVEVDMRSRIIDRDFLPRDLSFLTRVLFKPNRTLGMHLEAVREFVNACPQGPQILASTLVKATKDLDELTEKRKSLLFQLDPNLGGLLALMHQQKQLNRMVQEVLTQQIGRHQTLIVVALRLHELEQGSLPPTLEALVPAYLPEVPMDPFSGAPMKWNPKTAVVYSVGMDMKDDGGHLNTARSKSSKDICTVYWWAKAP